MTFLPYDIKSCSIYLSTIYLIHLSIYIVYLSIYLYIVSIYLCCCLLYIIYLSFNLIILSIKPFSPLFNLYIILFYLPLLWTIRPCFKVTFVVHRMDGSYALNFYFFTYLDIWENGWPFLISVYNWHKNVLLTINN